MGVSKPGFGSPACFWILRKTAIDRFASMSDPSNSDSPQVKLMHEWGQGFEKRDPAHIAKQLHKDYRHAHYPRSLGRAEQTREQWLEHIAGAISSWTECEVSYINFCLNPLRRA